MTRTSHFVAKKMDEMYNNLTARLDHDLKKMRRRSDDMEARSEAFDQEMDVLCRQNQVQIHS